MTTKDEIILGMHQHINPEALLEARNAGNLISYFTEVANRILGINTPHREDTQIHERNATEIRSTPNTIIPPTPQPRSMGRTVIAGIQEPIRIRTDDTVRVDQL